MYNPTRSRDRSHYEQFFKYHSALYRYVEATSLTPFADRARDRGLHALYVSLCRYLVPGLLDNSAAGYYDAESPEVEKITDVGAEPERACASSLHSCRNAGKLFGLSGRTDRRSGDGASENLVPSTGSRTGACKDGA